MAIVLIDPDYCSRVVMRHHLRSAGYTVIDGDSGSVLEQWDTALPELLIVDETAQFSNGQIIVDTLSVVWSAIPILLLRHVPAPPDPHATSSAIKPVFRTVLLHSVRQLLATTAIVVHPAVH